MLTHHDLQVRRIQLEDATAAFRLLSNVFLVVEPSNIGIMEKKMEIAVS